MTNPINQLIIFILIFFFIALFLIPYLLVSSFAFYFFKIINKIIKHGSSSPVPKPS